MFTRPPTLSDEEVADALRAGWNFDATSLEYAAVGFGSHHWIAHDSSGAKRFVTVDDLSKVRLGGPDAGFRGLRAAFETARRLSESGLDCLVAPERDVEGGVLRRLGEGFTIAVYPFLDARSGSYDEYSNDERQAVRVVLGRVHRATSVVEGVSEIEDFALPCRGGLEVALDELDLGWSAGPFAEPARELLVQAAGDVRAALAHYDALVDEVRREPEPWVITHGEPHAANVLWAEDGPRLIDWDTALIAPAGRDLWMLEPPTEVAPRDEAPQIALYRLWWDLAEIAGYVTEFRMPHGETEDMVESWKNLEHFVALISARGLA